MYHWHILHQMVNKCWHGTRLIIVYINKYPGSKLYLCFFIVEKNVTSNCSVWWYSPGWYESHQSQLSLDLGDNSLKAIVQNPRASVEKLSPKESVKGADTVLRGSVRAPKGLSEGRPKAANPRGRSAQGLQPRVCPRKIPREPSHTAPQHTVGVRGTLLKGQFFKSGQRIFYSCSD